MILSKEFIRQRESNDCGVACLAMATRVEYETARFVFDALGLGGPSHGPSGSGTFDVDHHGTRLRAAYSSNFHEMCTALRTLGARPKIRRFTSWGGITKPSIVKVCNGHKRDWHWVYAQPTTELGLCVLDPLQDLLTLDESHAKKMAHSLGRYQPKGCLIELH